LSAARPRGWAVRPRAATAGLQWRTPPGRPPRRDRSRRGSRPGWRGRGPSRRERPARAALPLHQGPNLDHAPHPCGRNPPGDLERSVEVVALDKEVAAEVLLCVHERAVGEQGLSVLDADGCRRLERLQLIGADHAGRLLEGEVFANDRLLLWRRKPLELGGRGGGVDLEQVLHGLLLGLGFSPLQRTYMPKGDRTVCQAHGHVRSAISPAKNLRSAKGPDMSESDLVPGTRDRRGWPAISSGAGRARLPGATLLPP